MAETPPHDPLDFLGQDPLTVRLTEAARDFVARCEDLAEGDGAFAADTLDGIIRTVKQTGYVTPGQVTAVNNIEAGAHRGREAREQRTGSHRYGSRRYEGYRR